jgi:hypothetical protein
MRETNRTAPYKNKKRNLAIPRKGCIWITLTLKRQEKDQG